LKTFQQFCNSLYCLCLPVPCAPARAHVCARTRPPCPRPLQTPTRVLWLSMGCVLMKVPNMIGSQLPLHSLLFDGFPKEGASSNGLATIQKRWWRQVYCPSIAKTFYLYAPHLSRCT
jgi:hypothetical protein